MTKNSYKQYNQKEQSLRLAIYSAVKYSVFAHYNFQLGLFMSNHTTKIELTHRIAEVADIPSIIELMGLSISHNMKSFLSQSEIEAAKETMGVDRTLIDDRTYFVIETIDVNKIVMVGCGGWGKRKTLYGGDHTLGRDDSFSNPESDPARIRAMYTHPEWIRQGIGTLLLELGEQAARKAGFKTIELGSTIPGEPLYLAKGYKEIHRKIETAANGAENVIIKMVKTLREQKV